MCGETAFHTVSILSPVRAMYSPVPERRELFLNTRQQAKCQCQPSFTGERCEVNQCRDYCKNGGACTASVIGAPTCRCLKGFTGPQCKLHTCQDYCHNGGNCTVSQGNQPTCRCPPEYLGDQCQYSTCEGYCENEAMCLQTANATKLCRCTPQFHGQLCELDKCEYCGPNGKCVPKASGEVMCSCPNGRTQPSCYTCLDFCTNGLCSIEPGTLLPQCKCSIGWRGYRCEVTASPVDSPDSSGSSASTIIPVLLLLLLALLVVGAILWYKRRMRG
ncbi:unnamed protein product [Oncorhynchus mykiss]|uniref:EGF-like domain-containing protein n=1 Tax=Oncorhynchus mykiss TaxID=8022 RepID=A0A060Y9T2_ONCMY|nr:unnamed protein product [Oncorhynchus mykiss]